MIIITLAAHASLSALLACAVRVQRIIILIFIVLFYCSRVENGCASRTGSQRKFRTTVGRRPKTAG